MGRCNEAYSLLLRFTELADSVRKQRHTAEVIALQELYKHEQLSVENLYWRTQAAERQSNVYLMATLSLLSLWIASTIYFFYWRNRRRLVEQQHQLASQQEELHHQRQVTTENLQRMAEMEQKEARLKETFFRRLNQRIVQEIEKGSNILLSDDDGGLIVLFEEPINPKVNVLLMKNGFPISGHRQSRQLKKGDITEDTLVLTMTLSEKVRLIEEYATEKNIYTLGEFVGEDTDILDPGGAEEEKYKECFDELFFRVNKVIQKIEEQYWADEEEEK